MTLLFIMKSFSIRIGQAIYRFFFRKISALGFGVMRSVWAGVNLFYMASMWQDVTLYFSAAGYFAPEHLPLIVRSESRFTLLTWVTTPGAVWALYLLLLLALACMMVGYRCRLMTILSVILLFSFQEHTFFMFAGGDTVMRVIGFILLLAPELSSFSVDRLALQYRSWRNDRTLLPAPRMSVWPYRLLLWQFIVLYITASWYKLLDPIWQSGVAVQISLHDTEFIRFPLWVSDVLTPITALYSYLAVLLQLMWVLLLIPEPIRRVFVPGTLRRVSLKRFLIYFGITFHLGIALLLDAGIFSWAMLAGYCGLLLDQDWDALRRWFQPRKGPLIVLFDGRCSWCNTWSFRMTICDWCKRLHLVDYHDTVLRMQYAGDIPLENLETEMHVRYPDGATLRGFSAVRAICKQLPAGWILVPFLSLPGISAVGSRVYKYIAKNRTCEIRR